MLVHAPRHRLGRSLSDFTLTLPDQNARLREYSRHNTAFKAYAFQTPRVSRASQPLRHGVLGTSTHRNIMNPFIDTGLRETQSKNMFTSRG